jgi:integrase
MAELPERMMLRAGTYYCRVWVPADVAPGFGRTLVVTSLRTKDLKVAKSRLARKTVELEDQFERVRSEKETAKQAPISRPANNDLLVMAKRHGAEAGEREIIAQATFFEQATSDPARLWSGDLTVLPTPADCGHGDVDAFTHFDRLVAEGDLDAVIAYLLKFRLRKRLNDLSRMRAAGNLAEFTMIADRLNPALDGAQRIVFARLLLSEELRTLQALQDDKTLPAPFDVAQDERDAGSQPATHVVLSSTIPVSSKPASVSLDELFQRWEEESDPSASTLSTWRGIVRNLKAHLGDKAEDIRTIDPDDIVDWKDALVKSGKAAKTISNGHLGCARALFRFAVANKLMDSDPAEGVRVSRKMKPGTKMLAYESEEVARLLKLASAASEPWKRWLPWLSAATGSRIGEMAQLHGNHILARDGIAVVKIAPATDGGSIKNAESERLVPIHSKLIEDGFLNFVNARGEGPLFYQRTSGDPKRKHASKGLSNRLAAWIRENGFTDPRKAPNHALRHWFKSETARLGIPDSVADAIQGHSDGRSSSGYRHIALQMMSDAIEQIKLPPSAGSQ